MSSLMPQPGDLFNQQHVTGAAKRVRVVAFDLPTSWQLANPSDDLTRRMFEALTGEASASASWNTDLQDRRQR